MLASYSPASEILEYFRRVARKYDLYRHIRLQHQVVGAKWDDTKGIWSVEVRNLVTGELFSDWCHFMITGTGILK